MWVVARRGGAGRAAAHAQNPTKMTMISGMIEPSGLGGGCMPGGYGMGGGGGTRRAAPLGEAAGETLWASCSSSPRSSPSSSPSSSPRAHVVSSPITCCACSAQKAMQTAVQFSTAAQYAAAAAAAWSPCSTAEQITSDAFVVSCGGNCGGVAACGVSAGATGGDAVAASSPSGGGLGMGGGGGIGDGDFGAGGGGGEGSASGAGEVGGLATGGEAGELVAGDGKAGEAGEGLSPAGGGDGSGGIGGGMGGGEGSGGSGAGGGSNGGSGLFPGSSARAEAHKPTRRSILTIIVESIEDPRSIHVSILHGHQWHRLGRDDLRLLFLCPATTAAEAEADKRSPHATSAIAMAYENGIPTKWE